MQELQIEYVPTDSIIPYANNARKHGEEDVDAIMASIRETGFNDPIGIWKGVIVEGHGRLIAAKRLGMDTVPVIKLDHLTDEQRRAYALAHNKTAELSGWDFDILAAELEELSDIDMSQFGFDLEEYTDAPEVTDDGYEPVNSGQESQTQRGQIWVLGDHRLMCGDSSDQGDMALLFEGGGKGRHGFH